MRWLRRKAKAPEFPQWEVKITSPDLDGPLVAIDTEALYYVWKYSGQRTLDGYLDILEMPRLHVYVRPLGWEEPAAERVAALKGTAAVLPGQG